MGKHQLITSVNCNAQNIPIKFKGLPVLEILEHWADTGRWWAGEAEKSFYRIRCSNESIHEIYWEPEQKSWYLYKTYD
ncbi:MAG: hypothetical protein PHX14_08070 [Syntrophomonadaceae bacterium]|nr:hypothetical protein [Syntrophomonadaceae bacterium]